MGRRGCAGQGGQPGAGAAILRRPRTDAITHLDDPEDLEDAASQLEMRRVAADAGDAEALMRPAHSLKSNSANANVGASALAEACRSLEADSRTGVVPDLADRVAACDRVFADVRAALLAERASR